MERLSRGSIPEAERRVSSGTLPGIGIRHPGVGRVGPDRVHRPASDSPVDPRSPIASHVSAPQVGSPHMGAPHVSTSQVGIGRGRAVRDDDPSAAMLPDKREQGAGVPGAEADAAVAGRAAKLPDRVRAVDCVSASEEQRVRHGRHVIFSRVPHALHPLHAVASGRGPITPARGGHRPRVGRSAIDEHGHALGGVVDTSNDACRCGSRKEAEGQGIDGEAHGTTSEA